MKDSSVEDFRAATDSLTNGKGYHVLAKIASEETGSPVPAELPQCQEEVREWKKFLSQELVAETVSKDLSAQLYPRARANRRYN